MNKFLFVGIVLLFSCGLLSCQKGDNTASPKTVTTGVAGQVTAEHDMSTPDRAILGHWVEQDKQPFSKTHLYVTPDKIITVTIHEIPYKVTNSDAPKRIIVVHAGPESGGHQKTFSFSSDMNSMTEMITMFEKPQTHSFVYVDTKREP